MSHPETLPPNIHDLFHVLGISWRATETTLVLQDREAGTARAALQALAHIVLSVESVGLIEMLMELLSSGDPHLVSEVLTHHHSPIISKALRATLTSNFALLLVPPKI